MCEGVLETVGRLRLQAAAGRPATAAAGKQLAAAADSSSAALKWSQPFTAHPKLDRATGELMFFGKRLTCDKRGTRHSAKSQNCAA